jgi:replicative DNA helicase
VNGNLLAFSDFEDQLIQDLADRADAFAAGRPRGPSSGFSSLDDYLDGCMEPGVFTLHGQPGSGKTSLAAQIAADCGFPSLYVTCEIDPLELVRRQVARITGRNRRGLFNGHNPVTDDMELFYRVREKLRGFHILDARREPARPEVISSSMMIVKGTAPHGFCVIDSLHSWAGPLANGETPEAEYIGKAMNSARTIAVDRGVPVMLLSERNRASMSQGGMSAGAGSRKIEYQSDVLMELAFPNDDRDGIKSMASGTQRLELRVLKNRFGPPHGVVALNFMGQTMSFREVKLELA